MAGGKPRLRVGLRVAISCAGLAVGLPGLSIGAEEAAGGEAGAETDRAPARADREQGEAWRAALDPFELRWSATLFGQVTALGSEEDSGDVGGFFDRYSFTPNKGSGLPLEIGLGEARLDVLEEDGTPRLGLLYESPSSNLGLTGGDIDDPFLNQHLRLFARGSHLRLDARARRIRTESLRIFPETGGSLLPFQDETRPDDRFQRDRSGFDLRLRYRPRAPGEAPESSVSALVPEVELRGGLDDRSADRQVRTLIAPGNDWLGLEQDLDRDVGRVGGGLVWGAPGATTLALDVDHRRLRVDSDPILDVDLPTTGTGRTVRFVPSTDRSTGSLRLRTRPLDRMVVTAAASITRLEQVSNRTPAQRAADLDRNVVTSYSGELRADIRWSQLLETDLFVELDHRAHDLDRSTPLFDPTSSSQIAPFLQRSTRLAAGGEARLRAGRALRLALGARLMGVDRDLDFPVAGLTNLRIPPENALVKEKSRRWRAYGRADLRPTRSLRVRAELGYSGAPETGYITELDEKIDGSLRVGWTAGTRLPLQISAFARGSTGENRDFEMVGGLAPDPQGARLPRDFERTRWSVGGSADAVLDRRVRVFGSVFFTRTRQSQSLALSLFQRTFQEVIPLDFRSAGELELETDELALALGARLALSDHLEATLSYALTRADARYEGGRSSIELALIEANRRIEATIHGLDLDLRHEIRPGLSVFGRYGLQHYDDDAPVPQSPGSAVRPFDRSTTRHTIVFGVTLEGARPPRRSRM